MSHMPLCFVPFACCYLQRYYYYITKGIQENMVASPPTDMMDNVSKYIPEHLLEKQHLNRLREGIHEEIIADFDFSSRKAISKTHTQWDY